MPAFDYNVCDGGVNVLGDVKLALLEPDGADDLHGVHPPPGLLQGAELPQYDPEAVHITPGTPPSTSLLQLTHITPKIDKKK